MVRPILHSAWAVCLCCSPALTSHQLCTRGLMSIWQNRLMEAHICNPRKWQAEFKPGFLQFGEPYLPGHHSCPCLSFSTSPQRNPPNPSVPIPLPHVMPVVVQTMCPPQGRRWHLPNLLGVFSQEPLVWREERGSDTSSHGVRLEQGEGTRSEGPQKEHKLPGGAAGQRRVEPALQGESCRSPAGQG